MFWDLLAILFLATAPILAGIIKSDPQVCSSNEFLCDSVRCLSLDHVCNGVPDCADGFDEDICVTGANSSLAIGDMVNRSRRQSGCRRNQWQCADGSCISFDGKCDGVVDCADGSDETHALCRKTPCQDNLFRCTYGACVDGTAPCNGIQECADNSDELLPRCSNVSRTSRGKFICDNGDQISVTGLCDGVADCTDGSDENIRACAGKSCADYLFQCAYGACVDAGSDCNGVQECADNSDESDELCNRTSTAVKPNVTNKPSPSPGEGPCVLPQHPANGRFEVQGDPFAVPGKRYNRVEIKVSCEQGYAVNGQDTATCDIWTPFSTIPKCERYCLVPMHPSLEFTCEQRRGNVLESRPCERREFPGVDIIPRCVGPNYYGDVSTMRCKDGGFDYHPKCHTECGKVTPAGKEYIIGGMRAKHGELPWHAGIYVKTTRPFKQVCGGSLASRKAVISAAHCFWKDAEGAQPAENYAVALGKIYRPWGDTHDPDAQFFDVIEIHLAEKFRGSSSNFQEDIAIVILDREVVYQTYIRPVCISLDYQSNSRQLQPGMRGKVAGWGLMGADGKPSQILLTVELPYVSFDQCYNESPQDFREYINNDKFCAGFLNGTALCEGDSGGGLSFPDDDRGTTRYYLRGIVSTAPVSNHACDPNARTTFTEIVKYEALIRRYVQLE